MTVRRLSPSFLTFAISFRLTYPFIPPPIPLCERSPSFPPPPISPPFSHSGLVGAALSVRIVPFLLSLSMLRVP
ncbi:hypothetical protein BT69DRAFT_1289772 [Atractiella rhizophila]|nr:hypothetical protein BT69DRAFT_1289772 [Atractiella rhizophila]